MTEQPSKGAGDIALVLCDVDGTLVGPDKELTDSTIEAVGRLTDRGIAFALTSGRPPRGMAMFVEPLGLTEPIGAFNGGAIVTPGMDPLRTLAVQDDLIAPVIDTMCAHGLVPWVYSGTEWYLTDPEGPHVARESSTVRFDPVVVDSLTGIGEVAKIVGVSDDHDAVKRAEADARESYGATVSASRSQPYYLDVTHPDANKGAMLRYLAARLEIPLDSVATMGDSPNDVLMFAHCTASIAMGNAHPDVQRAARYVTRSNDEDGFAYAIDRFVLGGDHG